MAETHRYSREEMMEIRESAFCRTRPEYLSKEFDNDDGLFSPDKWLQHQWFCEGLENRVTKRKKPPQQPHPHSQSNQSSSSVNKVLNSIIEATVAAEKNNNNAEVDKQTVLSPQRRGFSSGCRAQSPHANTKEMDKDKQPSRKSRLKHGHAVGSNGMDFKPAFQKSALEATSRSSRSGGSGGHNAASNSGSWTVIGPPKQQQGGSKKTVGGGGNHRRIGADRARTATERTRSSNTDEPVPEWMDEGPESNLDIIELKGFDDEPQQKVEKKTTERKRSPNADIEPVPKSHTENEPMPEWRDGELDSLLESLGLGLNGFDDDPQMAEKKPARTPTMENAMPEWVNGRPGSLMELFGLKGTVDDPQQTAEKNENLYHLDMLMRDPAMYELTKGIGRASPAATGPPISASSNKFGSSSNPSPVPHAGFGTAPPGPGGFMPPYPPPQFGPTPPRHPLQMPHPASSFFGPGGMPMPQPPFQHPHQTMAMNRGQLGFNPNQQQQFAPSQQPPFFSPYPPHLQHLLPQSLVNHAAPGTSNQQISPRSMGQQQLYNNTQHPFPPNQNLLNTPAFMPTSVMRQMSKVPGSGAGGGPDLGAGPYTGDMRTTPPTLPEFQKMLGSMGGGGPSSSSTAADRSASFLSRAILGHGPKEVDSMPSAQTLTMSGCLKVEDLERQLLMRNKATQPPQHQFIPKQPQQQFMPPQQQQFGGPQPLFFPPSNQQFPPPHNNQSLVNHGPGPGPSTNQFINNPRFIGQQHQQMFPNNAQQPFHHQTQSLLNTPAFMPTSVMRQMSKVPGSGSGGGLEAGVGGPYPGDMRTTPPTLPVLQKMFATMGTGGSGSSSPSTATASTAGVLARAILGRDPEEVKSPNQSVLSGCLKLEDLERQHLAATVNINNNNNPPFSKGPTTTDHPAAL